jgi:hypothetical protein
VKQKTTNAYPTEYNGEDWQPKLEGIQESVAVRRHLFSVSKVHLLPPFTTGLQNWSTPSVIMRSVSVNWGNDGNGASAPVRYHCEYCPDHPDFNACAGAYLAPSMEFFYTAEQLYRSWVGTNLSKEDIETYGFYSVGDIISIPGNDGKLHADDSLNRFLVLGIIAHAQILPKPAPNTIQKPKPNPDSVKLFLKRLVGDLPALEDSTYFNTKVEVFDWQLEHAASLIWHCEM